MTKTPIELRQRSSVIRAKITHNLYSIIHTGDFVATLPALNIVTGNLLILGAKFKILDVYGQFRQF